MSYRTRRAPPGTSAASHGVIPICAQLGHNLDAVCAALARLPARPRRAGMPVRMHLIRSFDVNRPGVEPCALSGGVVGGAISQGELHVGQEERRALLCCFALILFLFTLGGWVREQFYNHHAPRLG